MTAERHPAAPLLSTSITDNLTLPSPVLAASGTLGFGDELTDLVDFSTLGALITPTITVAPRQGNPPSRTAEAPSGLLWSTGLPNPGLAAFQARYLPAAAALPCPVIASVLGLNAEEWRELADGATSDALCALELNLTPPSLAGLPGPNEIREQECAELIRTAVSSARAATSLPLIAKLPSIGIDAGYAARIATQEGADIIAISHGIPGVAIREARTLRFATGVGMLAGPAGKAAALYQLWRVRSSVDTPVIASGGILSGEDAAEFLALGAAAVAVGLANLIEPTAILRITRELQALLNARNVSLMELRGSVRLG